MPVRTTQVDIPLLSEAQEAVIFSHALDSVASTIQARGYAHARTRTRHARTGTRPSVRRHGMRPVAERATLAPRPQTVLPPAWLSVVQGSSPLEMDGCVYSATASSFLAHRPPPAQHCQPQSDGK